MCRFDPIPSHDFPLRGFAIALAGHTTLGRTPLEEWSADAETSTRKYTTFATEKHPYTRRDRKQQFQ